MRGSPRIVYAAHNVERDYVTAQPGPSREWFARQVARLELRAVRAADLVVTCTSADAARLADLYGSPSAVAVIANGFDERDVRHPGRERREETRAALGLRPDDLAILFVGGRAAHNRRAARFLEHELLPQLPESARLLLVGECAAPRREARVLAFGPVDRLEPFLSAADLAVNPVVSGSGSNVKLAEYLGAGLPVVTTPVGLRGYEAFAHLTTISRLETFADAVLSAPRAASPPHQMGELSWSALGRRLCDVYSDLLAHPRPADTSRR